MLAKVGCSVGQVRIPSMQVACAQKAEGPQSASMPHCAGAVPPTHPAAARARIEARKGIDPILRAAGRRIYDAARLAQPQRHARPPHTTHELVPIDSPFQRRPP